MYPQHFFDGFAAGKYDATELEAMKIGFDKKNGGVDIQAAFEGLALRNAPRGKVMTKKREATGVGTKWREQFQGQRGIDFVTVPQVG